MTRVTSLTDEEKERYSRHIVMPEIGIEGQMRLKESKILIIGAGGLGSPVAVYLAAAGAGVLGIVDPGLVEISNLQRQILHSSANVGLPKAESARQRIKMINPNIEVHTYHLDLDTTNAEDIIGSYDVVADCTDNFPVRHVINEACVKLGKIMVYGSVHRFQGEVSVFDASRGPCYRCLHPIPTPGEFSANSAEIGVFWVLPGVIGSLEALEVMKIIIGRGDLLIGRIVQFDALKFTFSEIELKKDPACPLCGK